ncbi:MAG TPA: glycosyltransferase family 8 protein [Nostoc sp.]|uniref:glycosyltransferase family 8 protein n=1 Tax=Nostoc sp. TaxID=1180 RepID=UPI002D732E59|nr:glycosyltransferase family 8 protein [Nostoc sp.]HYX13518.1 glycosyltransferase family 8 protein [Nostoc sp.]
MTILSNEKLIVLVCAADDNFSMPIASATRSVIANFQSEHKLVLYIIDGGISKLNKQRITKNLKSEQVSINWLNPKKQHFKNAPTSSIFPTAAYYRLLIPQLLPKQFNKAIYIDSDVIVQGNIEELWNIDIGEYYLLAAQDMGAPYVSSPKGLINYQYLGISPESKYFNSGVLVMNLKKWREDKIFEKIIEYLTRNKQYVRWYDQDGMNAILAGKWGELEPRWNQMPFLFEYSSWQDSPFTEDVFNQLIKNPDVIHFATRDKPWHNSCKHPDKDLFFQYLDNSIWSNWHAEQFIKKERQRRMAFLHNIYHMVKQRIKSLLKA